jgi:hypothetical protein
MRISLERKKVTVFRSGEFRVYPRSFSGCMLLIKDLWGSR